MKDCFSAQSKVYAAFRPTYPVELYHFLFQQIETKNYAWDCATGTGQVAQHLAGYFEKVYATDISQKQLDYAIKKENILYSVAPAERTSFPDHLFDLVTVAQALHWFDRKEFYTEVQRVCKPGGVLAVWGYALLYIERKIDDMIMDFYNGTVGPYWDDARKLVEDEYRSIAFPFRQIPAPSFSISVQWTLQQLSGYFSSWSATQKFIKVKGYDPVEPFIRSLEQYWTDGSKAVSFPVFMKVGRV